MLFDSFQPSKLLILLVCACLIWIGLLSLGVWFFLGTSISTGWIVAGVLFLGFCVCVAVLANEIRCATDVPDDFDDEDGWDAAGAREKPAASRKRSVMWMIPGERQIARLRRMTAVFYGRVPQRLRFRKPAANRRKTRPRRSSIR